MESIIKYDEESINSCEEVVDHDSDSDKVDLGVGRSYECVFCKRGFNTAQALGGHMNIHRKDRPRNKPNNSINHHHHHHHVYTGPRFMIPSPHHHDHPPISAYFPSSTPTTRPYHHQQPLDIPGDWRLRLSLEFPPLIREDLEIKEQDLDLELRLGYH